MPPYEDCEMRHDLPPQWNDAVSSPAVTIRCGADGTVTKLCLDDCRRLGLLPGLRTADDAVGKSLPSLLPPSDLSHNLGKLIAGGKQVVKFVAWFEDSENARRWVVFDMGFGDEQSSEAVVTLWDVTGFMRADIERRCQTTREERILYDGARNSVTIHDDRGAILGVNQACADTLGYSLAAAQRIHLRDYVVGYTQEGLDAYWERVAGGQSEYPSGMYRLQDGWVATSVRLRSILLEYGSRSFMRTTSVTLEDSAHHHEVLSQGLGKILQLTDSLIESPDVDTLCLKAVKLGLSAIGLCRCSLYLVDGDTVHGTWGTGGDGEPTDERGVSFALDDRWRRLAQREGLYTPNSDVEWDATLFSAANGKPEACGKGWLAATPVFSGNRFLGVFFNDSGGTGVQYDPARQKLVEIFCLLLGSLIEMKRAEKDRAVAEKQFRGSERLQALGRLAGDIAHDVNNLVAPVATLPDEMLERLPHVEADPATEIPFFTESLNRIAGAAGGATALVREAIALGREGRAQTEDIDLADVLRSYTKSTQFQDLLSPYPEITFTSDIPDCPVPVKGSAPHLRRALAQIVKNALESMDGAGTLALRMIDSPAADPDSRLVRVEISDTGCGISDAHLPRVFEPYFSTKADTRSSGAGLSLAIVYDIVRQLEGDVEVHSTVGKGTQFVLSFPIINRDS